MLPRRVLSSSSISSRFKSRVLARMPVSSPAITTGGRGIAHQKRHLHRAGLSPPLQSFCAGLQSGYSPSLPNKGQVFRKIGRRKLVPYYDRGEIEDGKIAGRGLEVVWLKNQTDLLFIQIQGSARVKLEDGSIVRINYDAHNGFPVYAGRPRSDRAQHHPRDQMSMQRIREYMGAEIPARPMSSAARTNPMFSSARFRCPTKTRPSARRAFR